MFMRKLCHISFINKEDICMYLPNSSQLAGGNSKSIFKRNLTGLNLKFSLLDRFPYQG